MTIPLNEAAGLEQINVEEFRKIAAIWMLSKKQE
jgi:hypothetical protein